MNKKTCFIMGLPSAGKTTFLAALSHSIQQPNKTVLHLKRYIGNQQYLTRLNETWSGLEEVSRTSVDNEETNLTVLLEDIANEIYQISFPDLSGESFQKQYRDREISKVVAEKIIESDGILLFINPLVTTEPILISNIKSELRNEEMDSEILHNRNPLNDDPTEVQLVELLQFVEELRDGKSCNIGVIISAWDIQDESLCITPEEYVKEHLPLLWQYIYSNTLLWRCTYFGVSAQGGMLDNDNNRKKLANIEEPIDRILVVDNYSNKYNDITLPLYQILSEI